MTIKELLLQEIDSTPDELLTDILSLVRSLKSSTHSQISIYEQLILVYFKIQRIVSNYPPFLFVKTVDIEANKTYYGFKQYSQKHYGIP